MYYVTLTITIVLSVAPMALVLYFQRVEGKIT